ncbi:MAG: UMP kinase [Bacteroidales bacterium]|nr:UMP kinase [Bacteroidales bacterium]
MKYKRILLKLSGESLAGKQDYGVDGSILHYFADEIKSIHSESVQVAVVLGGGNIFRGLSGTEKGVSRVQGDYMGMMATVINSLALQDALIQKGIKATVLSGLEIIPLCKKMSSSAAIGKLEKGQVVIIAGGTGNPFFTTDSAAALRAVEVKADLLLKGTRVDGIYDADPEKNSNAKKFDSLSYDEALDKELKVMDMTAFTLCKENKMPIVVFDMNVSGNLKALLEGNNIGTIVN